MAVDPTITTAEDEDRPAQRYDHHLAAEIEDRWQDRWREERTFVVARDAEPGEAGKFFLMDMFPYPSGEGLHVGHPLGYIATDVLGRYRRMTGQLVLHTLGFDAFGLPAEQYAITTGTHPRVTTATNVTRFREQLVRLGLAHDFTRSIETTDPGFYRWTQWIFLQIYNSWYDEEAGRARPIAELAAAYAADEIPTPSGATWADLDAAGKAAALDARRLAYRAKVPVNWCPGLGTVLANEEVTADGRSERGNFPVFRREMTQWMMRITAYADRLIADLDHLDWSEAIKTMQRNWIGRSEGAAIHFPVEGHDETIEVFTTRPDTLFGATYMVLAPEHSLVPSLVPAGWPAGEIPAEWTGGASTPAEAVDGYKSRAARMSERDRQAAERPKTGVFTGAFARNPVTGTSIPIFIADYVLAGYGTGAIMAVPAHDQRDFDFARAFDLPIIPVIEAGDGRDPSDAKAWDDAYSGDGVAINSSTAELSIDGLAVAAAKRAVIDWLTASSLGTGTVTYKLRDWLFSRQRYWGEPFPIVYDEDGVAHSLPETMLPLDLPEMTDYRPRTSDTEDGEDVDEGSEPEAPLARAAEWVNVTLDLGDGPKPYRRETNTMPQWAGSCWYELRYLDPDNDQAFVGADVERRWMGPKDATDPGGVDLYVGGVEHAVLHLLYSRFWHKVLFDLGHLTSREPFRRLFNQGYIQAFAYLDSRGAYVAAAEVEEREGEWYFEDAKVERRYGKMGKSLKNSVSPDEMRAKYGADTLRLYEMSMGPLDASRPWDARAVVGSQRFLQRVWRVVLDEETGKPAVTDVAPDAETERLLHVTVEAVRTEMDALRFNTAIARLIELNNHLTGLPAVPRSVAEPVVLMLAPFAPHVAEELWARLGHAESLAYEPFPVADPTKLVADTFEYPVQVDGKRRAAVTVPVDAAEDVIREAALAEPNVAAHTAGRQVVKVVVVPKRIVSVVTKPA